MILRTPPPRKRRAESQLQEDNNNNTTQSPSSNQQLLVYEDLPAPEYSHDHAIPITSDQMLCTYQCRQMVCYLLPFSVRRPTLFEVSFDDAFVPFVILEINNWPVGSIISVFSCITYCNLLSIWTFAVNFLEYEHIRKF